MRPEANSWLANVHNRPGVGSNRLFQIAKTDDVRIAPALKRENMFEDMMSPALRGYRLGRATCSVGPVVI